MDAARHSTLAHELITACGGVDEIVRAKLCRVGSSQLFAFMSSGSGQYMPADVIHDLEAWHGEPIYSRALFEIRPAVSKVVALLEAACENTHEAARIQEMILEAERHAHGMSPNARRRIEAEIVQAQGADARARGVARARRRARTAGPGLPRGAGGMTAIAKADRPAGVRARRPEPEHRRSAQPVHRDSRMDGAWVEGFWRKMTWREKHDVVNAARRYDRANKKPGEKNGPIGSIGLELLEELAAMAVNFSGRVRPTLVTLAARIRRSKSTVVEYLRRLADAGIVEWVRRLVPKPDAEPWARGPPGRADL